jgi:hypothetical protein
MTMDSLELTWAMPGGVPGVDNSVANPLTRATERLFRTGQPYSRLVQCFFRGPGEHLRWLGVFVHSAGNRVLFFPGFAEPFLHVVGYNDKTLRWNRPFHVDHLTLEADRRSWHLTAPQSAEHLGKLAAMPLDSERTLWFGMSVASETSLHPLHEQTKLSVPVPGRDAKRRVEVFKQAREGAIFQIVALNGEHPSAAPPNFTHFSVVLGAPGFHSPENEVLAAPHGGEFVSPTLPAQLKQTPIRIHRVTLSTTVELQITTTLLPGTLLSPVVFTSPFATSTP